MLILRKLFALLAILLLASRCLSAQEFMQAFGVKMSVLAGTVSDEGSGSDVAIQVNELSYFPRYNFLEGDDASLSIGFPLGAGIGIARNSDFSDVGILLAYDLPVALDFNFGNKSTLDNGRGFGGYAGIGYGYSKVQISGSSYSDFRGAVYGPLVRAGVRFGSASPAWNGHSLDIGLYLKKGMGSDNLYVGGFNILYVL